MKKIALISIFISLNLIGQELPQFPKPPKPVIENPTSIMEETDRAATSIIPTEISPEVNNTRQVEQMEVSQESAPLHPILWRRLLQ